MSEHFREVPKQFNILSNCQCGKSAKETENCKIPWRNMLLCVDSFSVIWPIALKHKAYSAFVIYSAEIEVSKNKCAELTGTSIVGQRRNFSIRLYFTLSSLFINDGRLSFNFSLGNSNLKSLPMGTRSNYFGGDCVKYINFQPSVTGNYSSTTINCK